MENNDSVLYKTETKTNFPSEIYSLNNSNYRVFSHKNKAINSFDRRKEERRKTNMVISFTDRRIKERRNYNRRMIKNEIQKNDLVILDRLKKNSERLWDFYLNCGFLYKDKLNFLQPIRNEINETLEKLLNCYDDMFKCIFVLNKEEIIGSVMAVQYTNNTWMVQHIVTSPHYKLVTKELILEILLWMLKNKKMHYFINYFQEKTKWAYKTYNSLLNYIGGTDISIDNFDYLYIKLSDYKLLQQKNDISIDVFELTTDELDCPHIYQQLSQMESNIFLNALGLEENSFSIEEVEKHYRKLDLCRTRKYFIAEEGNKMVGFSFVDISSYGISLSLLFNICYIFIFDESKKVVIYRTLINKINQLLRELGQIYSIVVIKPSDKEILEKIEYKYSRSYSIFTFSRENEQFTKIYNFVNKGRK